MDGFLGLYTGTLLGMGATTGRIEIDGEFPKAHPGEQAAARAHVEDFASLRGYEGGAKVSFELWRINGDLIAKKISKA